MTTLSSYTEAATAALLEKTGTFFAFSNEQFEKNKIVREEGTIHVSLGCGGYVPEQNLTELVSGLGSITSKGIAKDLAENGKDKIISRELGNHEAQLTGDITDTVEALVDYDITVEEVQAGYVVFYQKCIDNDWF